MLETQVGLTMLLSDRAIPYLLKTSINMLLLQTLIYVRVYFIRLLSEIPTRFKDRFIETILSI